MVAGKQWQCQLPAPGAVSQTQSIDMKPPPADLLQNGTLKIIDRKKHIFKLAQGEYISPEKIEIIYIRSQPVAQLYVHGDSLQVSWTFSQSSPSSPESSSSS